MTSYHTRAATVPEHYERLHYPHPPKFPILNCHQDWCFGHKNKRILVVGCGTIEAVILANTNPESFVTGIDVSKSQLAISKSIARHYKIRNLEHRHLDVLKMTDLYRYDIVIACGVLHHIEDVNTALRNISRAMKRNGVLIGFVYNSFGREDVIRLKPQFERQGYDLHQIRDFFSRTHVPRHDFFLDELESDVELRDTWLVPYDRSYATPELSELLNKHFNLALVVSSPHKHLFISHHDGYDRGNAQQFMDVYAPQVRVHKVSEMNNGNVGRH
jgi:SAM-dependent methyltransferase